MENYLLVPFELRGLLVEQGMTVAGPSADFSSLPWFDQTNKIDQNPDTPYLAEEILSEPFQNDNFFLSPGFHIHFVLPDTFNHADPLGSGSTFPNAPDRWYVRREAGACTKEWIIESDYLWAENEIVPRGTATYPKPYGTREGNDSAAPFWYIGRQYELDQWQPGPKKISTFGSYLKDQPINPDNIGGEKLSLTTMGWGHPSFDAFYPNCKSVFGFHDALDDSGNDSTPFTYTVIGWYSDTNNDFLRTFTAEVNTSNEGLARYQTINGKTERENHSWGKHDPSQEPNYIAPTLEEYILRQLHWRYDKTQQDAPDPDGVICHASLKFDPATKMEVQYPEIQIAMANTGTEAISAYLAGHLANGDSQLKADYEDQLEAVLFGEELLHHTIDVGPNFVDMRHKKGFDAVPSGKRWGVKLRAPEAKNTSTDPESPPAPGDWRMILDKLNGVQREYDKTKDVLDSLKARLYADWCKYMVCAYPPEDEIGHYPAQEQVMDYIKTRDIPEIKHTMDLLGAGQPTLNTLFDNVDSYQVQDPAQDREAPLYITPLSKKISDSLRSLCESVNLANSNLKAIESNYRWAIEQTAGPRYWVPKPPVLLIAMDHQDDIDPHAVGQKESVPVDYERQLSDTKTGDLETFKNRFSVQCGLWSGSLHDLKDENAVGLWFDQISSKFPSDGYPMWKGNYHYPFMLEWEVEVLYADAFEGQRFNPDFLLKNYFLGENNIDFVTAVDNATSPAVQKNFTPYTGASLMSINASKPLAEKLKNISEVTEKDLANADKDQGVPKDLISLLTLPIANPQENANRILSTLEGLAKACSGDENLLTSIRAVKSALDDTKGLTDTNPAKIDALKQTIKSTVDGDQSLEKALQADQKKETAFKKLIDNAILILGNPNEKTNPGKTIVTQPLNGFNAALMQQQLQMRLPAFDPLGFEHYKDFATEVRNNLAEGRGLSPEPRNKFFPFRAGALSLIDLRLIDTFGRVHQIPVPAPGANDKAIYTCEAMKEPDQPNWIRLNPRFSHPMRVNFRLLAADALPRKNELMEMNSHEDSHPICGWLVPNLLEGTLQVFDANGESLGEITYEDQWVPSPIVPPDKQISVTGRGDNLAFSSSPMNPHLEKTLLWMLKHQSEGYPNLLEGFLNRVEDALENIAPDRGHDHHGLSVLMGRPMAVVRAKIELQIKGLPPTNQSWDDFRIELGRPKLDGHERDSNGYLDVKIPMRLGEYRQQNDSLLGYWVEGNDGEIALSAPFVINDGIQALITLTDANTVNLRADVYKYLHDCQASENQTVDKQAFIQHFDDGARLWAGLMDGVLQVLTPIAILQHASDAGILSQAVSDGPKYVTMLMEPHGKIHLTTGVQPVKSIEIPTDQYTAALKNIEMYFKATPVITPRDHIRFSLPQEDGYQWIWGDPKTTGALDLTYQRPFVRKSDLEEAWEKIVQNDPKTDTPVDIWDAIPKNGVWLAAVVESPGMAFICFPDPENPWFTFTILQSPEFCKRYVSDAELLAKLLQGGPDLTALLNITGYSKNINLPAPWAKFESLLKDQPWLKTLLMENNAGLRRFSDRAEFPAPLEVREAYLLLRNDDAAQFPLLNSK